MGLFSFCYLGYFTLLCLSVSLCVLVFCTACLLCLLACIMACRLLLDRLPYSSYYSSFFIRLRALSSFFFLITIFFAVYLLYSTLV